MENIDKADAEKAVELLKYTFDIKRKKEMSNKGLIIDDAWYGVSKGILGNNKENDEVSEGAFNVTRQLQCLVDDSHLVLPEGDPKAVLQGK